MSSVVLAINPRFRAQTRRLRVGGVKLEVAELSSSGIFEALPTQGGIMMLDVTDEETPLPTF